MRWRRTPTPDFIRSRKLKRDERFLQFLTFGMVFDHHRAEATVQWAEECREQWAASDGDEDLSNDDLEQQLLGAVGETLQRLDPSRTVTMGLSSGYDSRPLLRSLWALDVTPWTYTFGQVGNLDFDLVRVLAPRLELDNIFIDTSEVDWPLALFDQATRTTQDMPISPRTLAARKLDDRFPARVDLHGYLNGSLTGSTTPDQPSRSWDEAIAAFCANNDQFGLQRLLPDDFAASLLPRSPVQLDAAIPYDRQLDLGYRQAQRIRLVAGQSDTHAFPFEHPRWVGYWLNRTAEDLDGQRRWLEFVTSLRGELFFDLPGLDERRRGPLRKRRLARIYGDGSTAPLVDAQAPGKQLPLNPTQHFCPFACHRNNRSFGDLVAQTITRLRGRRALDDSLIDDAMRRFGDGEREGGKMLLGLMSTDLALEAGRL